MVFPNHMTTAMTSLQLASFWIIPHVNNVAAYRINLILHQTQWIACLFTQDIFAAYSALSTHVCEPFRLVSTLQMIGHALLSTNFNTLQS